MRRLSPFIILLFFTYISISAQQFNKADIDLQVAKLKEQGLYLQASGLLIKSGIYFEQHGDTVSALHCQLQNCNLIDEHLDLFRNNGVTPKIYYSNWYITISLMGWLKKQEAIPYFIMMLNKMNGDAPELLPFYSSELSYLFDQCKDANYRDSVYILQKALNVIKSQSPTPELVRQFIDISLSFNNNRFNNSFNEGVLSKNRLQEIKDWYSNNCSYIHNLNIEEYRDEIIEYETDYANKLYLYAGSISTQENNPLKAISLYEEEKSIIFPLIKLDRRLSQKIAACNAMISQEYCFLGDFAKGKEYNDSTLKLLVYHEDDLEYCDILNSAAFTSFIINNKTLAAQLKLIEILIREELGWKCSQSEWSQYFMYVVDEEPQNVLDNKDVAIKARKTHGEDYGLFLKIGKAYSLLMSEMPSYKDSAEYYFHKAERALSSNYSYYDKIGQIDNAKSNIDEEWAAHYMLLGDFSKSYNISKSNINNCDTSYFCYRNVAAKASFLHDIEGIHRYLPKYYYGLEEDIYNMMPILGTFESNTYLGNGEMNLYHIPEWASWNPTDTVSLCVAYDAALLMKGLTLRYNTLAPYMADNPSLASAKQKLDKMQDSIYTITDNEQRFLAYYKHKQEENAILKEICKQMTFSHWKDVKQQLNEKDVCIEFVKYTANAYSWGEGTPMPHYAAILLLGNNDYPVFVDLFDELELDDTYILQPKSYDTETGNDLYEKLWGKLNGYIDGYNRVFFSPMGMLNLINIEALADSNGQTALERYNLTRVSSTRQLNSANVHESISSVISFGGIDYDKSASEIVDSLNTRGNWSYLKNTLAEVNSVEKSFNTKKNIIKTVTGEYATEASFKQLDGTNANVIHLASHGFYIPAQRRKDIPYYSKSDYTQIIENELFYSGLIMSGGQSAWKDSAFVAEKDDGILTSYEISKLDLHNVNLVVLSACETGLGDNLYDGIYGLQRAFKKAGARTILMSLWNINDKATSEYMELFYYFLTSGLSKQESYRRTVVEMKKRYEDPYYWASFIMLD